MTAPTPRNREVLIERPRKARLTNTPPASAVIRAMKMRGGFETDTALAQFLGRSQSAVAHWRRKGVVPEGALVRFESRISGKDA